MKVRHCGSCGEVSLAEAADPRVQAEKEAGGMAGRADHPEIGQVVLQVIPRMRGRFFHV